MLLFLRAFLPFYAATAACGVLIDIHDNTDGHQLSERLLIENQKLQSIFQEAPFMMAYATTDDFTLQFVNEEFARFYNNRPLQGLPVRRAIPEAHQQGFDDLLQEVVSSGRPFSANAMEVRVYEGQRAQSKYVDFIYHPVKDDGGEISGVLCTGMDVTEKVEARIGLEKTRHSLLHASRINAMGTVAMTLAHELNQPLTAAANYLSVSRRLLRHDHKEATEPVGAILHAQEQIDRAGDIIRRLRPLIQSGEAERRTVPISAAVDRSVGLLLASGKFDLAVSKDISRDAAYVLADQIQLEQVLVNLLRNADEASKQSDRKEVIIATSREDVKYAVISVRDYGSGLADDQIGELRSTQREAPKQGLGVGLLLSRTLVEANGGSLRAANAATGPGAVFEIVLQASEPKASQSDE
ncbi:MAG: ATP-binding protein [Sphingomonadaceae bacterium]